MRKMFILVMLLALPLVASNAWAQGFGVYEQSACATARGGAGVASPCNDGSGIFYNPASLGFVTGQLLSAGATVITPRGDFTNRMTSTVGSLNVNYYPVPNVYYAKQFKKVVVGAGLFAPYGLTTDWPVTFEGRFLGYKTMVKGVYVQPTVAYKVNDNFAIGGGVDITYASLELNQRLDLSPLYVLAPGQNPAFPNGLTFAQVAGVPPMTDFGDIKLSGTTWQAGYHLGLQANVVPGVSIGMRYLSRQHVNIDAGTFNSRQISTPYKLLIPLGPTLPAGTPVDAMVAPQFASGGSLADNQAASTGIVFPDQFVIGTAFKVAKKTTMFVDYQFTHWSLFDQIVITRANSTTPTVMKEDYDNTHALRLGAEHELNQQLTLRAGFVKHTAASPPDTVTPLLPEGPRWLLSGGVGASLSKGMRADFYYTYLSQADREGRTVSGTSANNNGTYSFMSHLFGATLVVQF